MKTRYVNTVLDGEEERIVFLWDLIHKRCPIITNKNKIIQKDHLRVIIPIHKGSSNAYPMMRTSSYR